MFKVGNSVRFISDRGGKRPAIITRVIAFPTRNRYHIKYPEEDYDMSFKWIYEENELVLHEFDGNDILKGML